MQRAALIALVVLCVLGVAAWWALRTPATVPVAPATPWLSTVNIADVQKIEVHPGDGAPLVITRLADSPLWILQRRGLPAGGLVRDENVRGAFRLLTELDALPAEPSPLNSTGSAAAIAVTSSDGTTRHLHLVRASLAGRSPVTLLIDNAPRTVLADSRLLSVFSREGILAWRDSGAVSRLAGEPTRLSIETGGRTLTLQRGSNRWSLAEPLIAPADPQACAAFLDRVFTWQVRPTLADASALSTLTPRTVLSCETPIRGEAQPRTLRQTVRLYDTGGTHMIGVVDATWTDTGTNAWGPSVFETSQPDAAFLSSLPGPFLSRIASQIAPADISGLRIGPVLSSDNAADNWTIVMERGLSGWTRVEGDTRTPASSEDAEAAAALLTLLCETPASASMLEAPAGTTPFARVVLMVGTVEAESLEVGRAAVPLPNGTASVIVIGDRKTWRVYPAEASQPLVDWLGRAIVPDP